MDFWSKMIITDAFISWPLMHVSFRVTTPNGVIAWYLMTIVFALLNKN